MRTSQEFLNTSSVAKELNFSASLETFPLVFNSEDVNPTSNNVNTTTTQLSSDSVNKHKPKVSPHRWTILFVFDIYGIRLGVLFGAFLNAFGTLFRFFGSFGPSGFWWLFLGQAIASGANVFILGIPPKLANTLFHVGEQNLATAIGVTANNAGIAFGFLLSPYMIKEATASADIPRYMLLQFGVCIIIYVFLIFTFKIPPGDDHSLKINERVRITSLTTLKDYFKNWPFLLLATAYGIVIGAQYALSTLLSQIIVPVYNESKVGFLGFSIVVAGVFGSFLIGIYLDYTFAFKKACRVIYLGALISWALFNIGLAHESLTTVFVASILFGVFSYAISPVVFQFVTRITSFQQDEIKTTGILNTGAQIWGILLVTMMDAMENVNQKFTMRLANWVLFGIMAVGTRLLWMVEGAENTELYPTAHENQENEDVII
ncbi:hypothetical protein G9A89_007221 [Geosiphon pyriformis]|nr:hypothetical protein G9A89_007221 [Geosiphon pyriformis]